MTETVLVTGGCGYVGAALCEELVSGGREVRALDLVMHGQDAVVSHLERIGVQVLRGDLRDDALRERALTGADAVVHLAAIVGDPACALDPELSEDVNVRGSQRLHADALRLGVTRMVFASTCSNYGRMADPSTPVTEEETLAPVSLYARQKVGIERALLADRDAPMTATCLRFATVYGVAPRMRFDLTVNEFTRDLWADRDLEVFGEQFWRPYVHVRDAGRAVVAVLDATESSVRGAVYNVGRSDENYRKLDIVAAIRKQTECGNVSFISRTEDPRDYRVSFDKIRSVLGFEALRTVHDGIAEVLTSLEAGAFPDPFEGAYRNVP